MNLVSHYPICAIFLKFDITLEPKVIKSKIISIKIMNATQLKETF